MVPARAGGEVVLIEPRHPARAVSIAQTRYQVELAFASDCACGSAAAPFRDLRTLTPFVRHRILEVELRHRRLRGELPGEGSGYQNLPIPIERLEVV